MNITKTPWFLVVGLALGATACGDDDSGTNSSRNGGSGDAAADCEALVAKMCEEWLVPCASISQPDCVAQVRGGLVGGSCAGADRVGARYGECMEDLDAITCEAKAVPSACNSVILYE